MLPWLHCSLLVRTDFSSDDAWRAVCDEALREYEDGFRAYLEPVSDSVFDGVLWERRLGRPWHPMTMARRCCSSPTARRSPRRITQSLVVDLLDDSPRPFRCIPPELWAVENNLNIANIDWESFADEVDEDGVYRGLRS